MADCEVHLGYLRTYLQVFSLALPVLLRVDVQFQQWICYVCHNGQGT